MKNSIHHILTYTKVILSRSSTYVGILNTLLIAYLIVRAWEITYFWKSVIISVYIGFIFLLGYLDDKLNVFKAEQKMIHDRSPVLTEILGRITKIEETINGNK